MNKNAIRRFAIYAREELIKRVTIQAATYGVTGKDDDAGAVNAGDRVFSPEEREWRGQLVRRVRRDGFEQVMEEVAYTWFNRFCALRFMEVNGYLPSRVRVFTDEANAFRPQMLAEALHLELEGLDRERVLDLKGKNDDEALYRYLLITQCNALAGVLPGLFQRLDAETSLLCPDNLLHEDSVLAHLVTDIPEEDWRDQVQVIGWLYQYYNAVPKDMVFAALKKNIKVSKENIPAATQLFTPDWIVRYMVENSLGRLWLEGHPDAALRAGWKYYLNEAEQEPAVAAELAKLRADRAALRPEEIRCIDPCMGSGHILVYMFDVLMQIYRACGYPDREAVQSIVQNNLYGLDIDERAAQLAYFAVMMKAVQYDRRFLRRGVQPHVCAVPESAPLPEEAFAAFGDDADAARRLHAAFLDGKEYGSLTEPGVTLREVSALRHRMLTMHIFDPRTMKLDSLSDALDAVDALSPLVDAAEMLLQKYDVVATNPPYMGASNMNAVLAAFVKKEYPDSKGDLFAVFIERCRAFAKADGYQAMITQHAWMFLSSFEKLRMKLQTVDTQNMAHLGARAFEEIGGEVVQTTSFVLRKSHVPGYKGTYVRLIEPTTQQGKEDMFLAGENRYTAQQDNFSKIPGAPVAYWLSSKFIQILNSKKKIGNTYRSGSGLSTADNDRFLRQFWEVDRTKIATTKDINAKWYLFQKGGEYRKWYGNLSYIVNWENDGAEIKYWVTHNPKDPNTTSWSRRIFNTDLYFLTGITWSVISSGDISFRATDSNAMISNAAGGIFGFQNENERNHLMAGLNSKIWRNVFSTINPTLNYSSGVIQKAPVPSTSSSDMGSECVILSKKDWDSYETSWDFKHHPLLRSVTRLADAYTAWKSECEQRFLQLKANEEELNRIFIDIYGLQDELTPEVADRDVTVHRVFDTKEDVPESMKGSNYVRTKRDEVVSLISYAVGCMFGRYSLDVDGLVYAGGVFSDQWIVVSGQLVNRKVVEECVGKELSRAFGMAEVDVAGGGDLPAGETAAERGVICLIRPDEKGGCVGPLQYRRGTSKKLYEGICELSLDRPGFSGGIGNTVYDLCSPEILDAITNRNGDALVRRGWADAERFDWEAVHQSLTTSHRPLPTDHQPLTTSHFPPDRDGILPICDDEYFEDDIVGMFARFLEAAYGKQTLEDNLRFVAEALGGSGAPREVIRAYFLNEFFADHCKTYQKRPIYWLFDSGKKNGFKALIYMHRYAPDTIARIRTDYLHEQQSRYRTAIAGVETRLRAAEGAERVRLSKQLEKLQAQAEEARLYEEKIHHLADQMIAIDLDDGVKVNYAKFADVLAKIK